MLQQKYAMNEKLYLLGLLLKQTIVLRKPRLFLFFYTQKLIKFYICLGNPNLPYEQDQCTIRYLDTLLFHFFITSEYFL